MILSNVNSNVTDVQKKNSNTSNSSNANKSIKKDEYNETPSAVYDKSDTTPTKPVTYKQDITTIDKLKEEADKRTASLRNLVEKMLLKQGITLEDSSMYQMLKEGKVEVTEEVRQKAAQDISEDGYYGIKQTSDRLVSFAIALTGGDPNKADEMIAAVKNGFEEATKTWGGQLPDICSQTIEATITKLEDWKNSISK